MKKQRWIWIGVAAVILAAALIILLYYSNAPQNHTEGYLVRQDCKVLWRENSPERMAAEYVSGHDTVY